MNTRDEAIMFIRVAQINKVMRTNITRADKSIRSSRGWRSYDLINSNGSLIKSTKDEYCCR